MPYRRFPKTDTARLRSLGELLDNNDVYAAKTRFISMDVIAKAKNLHDQLKTLSKQFLLCYEAQMRNYKRVAKPQKHMMMYLQHFVRVLLMSVERGEIKGSALSEFYAIDDPEETLRQLHIVDDACKIAPMIIEGEKKRIAAGGRPIYNPTIGMVATHFDIFADIYKQQRILNDMRRPCTRPVEGYACTGRCADSGYLEYGGGSLCRFATRDTLRRMSQIWLDILLS